MLPYPHPHLLMYCFEGDMARHKYAVLDGMRGIAAIAVMAMHYTWNAKYELFASANLAVDFFFMLSGFVIFHAYGEKLLSGRMQLKDFLIKRLIRLYPMFFLGLIIGTTWLWLNGRHSLHEFISMTLSNVLFIPYIATSNVDGIFPASDPSWSLFFELFVNLFILQMFCLNQKQLLKAARITLCVWIVCGAIAGIANDRSVILLCGGWDVYSFFVGFPRVFYGFIVGILIYGFVKNNEELKTYLVNAWYTHPYILYALMAAILLFPYEIHGVYALLGVCVMAPALLIAGANSQRHSFFSLPISRFLGWISYPLYCLHRPIYKLLKLVFEKIHFAHMGGGLVCIAIMVSLIASVIFCKFYEEPVRAWLDERIFSRFRPNRLETNNVALVPLPQEL